MSTHLPKTRDPTTQELNTEHSPDPVNPGYEDYENWPEYETHSNSAGIPAEDPTDYEDVFRYNIQLTSIVIIVVIGVVIIIIFLVSLWLSKRQLKKVLTPPSRMKAIWTNIQILPFRPAIFFSRRSSATRATQEHHTCPDGAYDVHDDATDDSSPMVTESQCSSTCSNWNKPNCAGNTRKQFQEDRISCDIHPDPESSDIYYEDAEDESLNPSILDLSHHTGTLTESINPPTGRTTSCSSSDDLLLYKIITV